MQFSKTTWLGLAVVLLGLTFFFWLVSLFPDSDEGKGMRETGDVSLNQETSGSDIYLSLFPFPLNENAVSIYRFEVGSRTLTQLLVPFFQNEHAEEYVTSKLSPRGDKMALGVSDFASSTSTGLIRVLDAETLRNTGEVSVQALDPQVTTRISPVWSPDGTLLAYTGRAQDGKDSLMPENWSIYIFDLSKGEERFLTTGSNPLFIPDGRLLILKNDGLHLLGTEIDPRTETSLRIWDVVGGPSTVGMKLNISEDGTMLAWTIPHKNETHIIRVTSWRPFLADTTAILSGTAFWPVFSPDGKFLAVQEVDVEDGKEVNPRLVLYDLATLNRETILDLKAYSQAHMFITDWR